MADDASDGPPLLIKVESRGFTQNSIENIEEMPSLEKVQDRGESRPFRQYISDVYINGHVSPKKDSLRDQKVPERNKNGHVPFARDINMSILKLASKLRQAQKKHEHKILMNKHKQIVNGAPFSVKLYQTNGAGSPQLQTHSIPVIRAANKSQIKRQTGAISLLKPIPQKVVQNGNVPSTVQALVADNIVKPEPVEIPPLELPKKPVDAINLLTGLQFGPTQDEFPESTGLPLWPLFSATRDGGARMDTTFLDRFFNNSGVLDTAEVQKYISKKKSCDDEDNTGSEKCKTDYEGCEKELLHSIMAPENLDESEIGAIENLAVETISKQYMPRLSRKSIDITKAVIDLTRRSVFRQSNALRLAFDANSKPTPASITNVPLPKSIQIENMDNLGKSWKLPLTVTVKAAPSPTLSPSVNADGILSRKYKCSSCKYQTDNRSHLRRHESSVHSGEKLYECYLCKIDFARSEKCRTHMAREHPEVQYDPRMIRKDRTYCGKPVDSLSPSPSVNALNRSGDGEVNSSGLDASEEPMDVEDRAEDLSLKRDACDDSMDASEAADASRTSSFNYSNRPTTVDQLNNSLVDDEYSLDSSTLKRSNSDLTHGSSLLRSAPGTPSTPKSRSKQRTSTPLAKLQCPQCSYSGKDIWHVKRHIQDVHNKKAYQCKMCSYVASRKHRLIKHMQGHGTLTCLHCDFRTEDFSEFQAHLKLCSAVERLGDLTCRECHHVFHNRKLLQEHALRKHGALLYTCDMCYFSTIDQSEYEQHAQDHVTSTSGADENEAAAFVCRVCARTFKTETLFEQHAMAAHRNTDVDFDLDGTFIEERDGVYLCLMCSFETTQKATMTAHIEHHKAKWFRCNAPNCSFVAATKKALNRHKASDHLELLQAASYTKAGSIADSSHIYDKETGGIQGHGSGMWQCHICPDKTLYRYRRSYEKHMAKHQGLVEPSIEVQSQRSLPALDPDALTCLMCGAQGWADRTQLQAHLLQSHGMDAFDHHDDDSAQSSSSSAATSSAAAAVVAAAALASAAHSPRMSDAHVQMLRQIAANASTSLGGGGLTLPHELDPSALAAHSIHSPTSSSQWHRSESVPSELYSRPAGNGDSNMAATGSRSPRASSERGVSRIGGEERHFSRENSSMSLGSKRGLSSSSLASSTRGRGGAEADSSDEEDEDERWSSKWRPSAAVSKRLKSD